ELIERRCRISCSTSQPMHAASTRLPGQGRELYAVGNRDPRSGANIIGRGLVGSLGATVVVAAPLYKQHFCLQNGNCLEDPTQRLPVWPVRIRGMTVELGQRLR
ncbi:MAG: nitrite reductase (NAD(P)H) small subunit, partial [Pseudomonas sp.]|nr:nitrite reductase (NAD(P)H) small subunit [Pseudomonas sp.]